MNRVLILDGMWNKSLAAVRTFGRRKFFVAAGERTRLAAALFSRYCSKRIIYPSPVRHREEFLWSLEKELIDGNYDVVLPMELSTQLALASHSGQLSKYTRIPFFDAPKTMQVQDKAFLMKHANEHGFDIPATYFVEDLNQLNETISMIDFPAVIKPRISSGSRGIAYVKDRDDFINTYHEVHERYPFPIIQECLRPEGEVFGVGLLLNTRSEIRASFVYKRLRSYPVSGGPSTLRESVRRDDIRDIAAALMKSLGWAGIAHVEFKIDSRDGRPRLLEVNPRFWGSLQLAIESGIDFPYLLYRMTMDGDIEPVTDYRIGVRCRWLIPGDLMHFLNNPDRLKLMPEFFSRKIKDDVIAVNDPLPTVGRILSVLTFLYDEEMKQIYKRRGA